LQKKFNIVRTSLISNKAPTTAQRAPTETHTKNTYTNPLTSKFPSASGVMTPFSVTIPVMFIAGVTSNAGFQQGTFAGAFEVLINSSAERSSMGISSPLFRVISREVMGAAT
jgi:hypothetical protein